MNVAIVVPPPIIVDSHGGGGDPGTVGWILLAVWLAGVVLATYPSYLLILKFMDEDDPDSTDKAFGGFIGFLLAGLWPLVAAGYVAFKVSRRLTNAVLGNDDRERTP